MLRATKALIHADVGEAQDVLRVHVDLTVRIVEAEASVLQLLRHEGDPRDLAVSLQTVADVNQMNTLARRVARVAMRPSHCPKTQTATSAKWATGQTN